MPVPSVNAERHITLDAVRDAATAVYRAAIRTPLVRLHAPDLTPPGVELFLKLELLQPVGSFKIRGAFNAVRQLSARELEQGIWTVSAGNAAFAVAYAARMLGARCSVLVMDTTPQAKLRAIERLGAAITRVSYEECWQAAIEHRSDRMSGSFIHPFDDDRFIAGNGTLALEVIDDLPDVDAVVASLGGGGLMSGIAAVMRVLSPRTRLYAAEPATAAPLATSLERREPCAFDAWTSSFVDGAGGRSVLETMWPLLKNLDGSLVVPLDDAARAMAIAAERMHLVTEGAGACALAAALSGRAGTGKIVVILSGGNIDLSRFAALVGACDNRPPVSL
jgi:threonine dehydratase